MPLIRSIGESNHFFPQVPFDSSFTLFSLSWDGALLRTRLRGFFVLSGQNKSSNFALALYCHSYSRAIHIFGQIARTSQILITNENQLHYLFLDQRSDMSFFFGSSMNLLSEGYMNESNVSALESFSQMQQRLVAS